jgi:TetR/AcrR family transcriptional regulator
MEKKKPTKPKARVRDAAETQRRVLQAAQDLFSQHSFAGVRLRQIADKAGITVPLLCHHFRDKASLYQAIQERLLARFALLGQEIFSTPGSAPERLEGLLLGLFELLDTEQKGFSFLHRELVEGGQTKELVAHWFLPLKTLAIQEFILGQERGELRRDLDPEILLLHLASAAIYPTLAEPLVRALFGSASSKKDWRAHRKEELKKLLRSWLESPTGAK